MDWLMCSEVKLAIILKEFCEKCDSKENCLGNSKCKVVEFAEYILEEWFVEKYLMM